MRRLVVWIAVAVSVFSSCTKTTKPATEGAYPASFSVSAVNYGFTSPATVASGSDEIELTNNGQEPHQAQLLKLDAATTIARLVSAGKSTNTDAAIAALGVPIGGPNAVGPHGSQTADVTLQPGRYAFVCLLPDAKGRAHLGLGMVRMFVAKKSSSEPVAVSAGHAVSAKEFKFALPAVWTGKFTFTNAGKQPHEFEVIGIAPGKTPADVQASFNAPPGKGPAGPPPWTADGGGAVIVPGRSETFDLALKPGTYFAMCFVTDQKTHAPHFALGMFQRFEVKAAATPGY